LRRDPGLVLINVVAHHLRVAAMLPSLNPACGAPSLLGALIRPTDAGTKRYEAFWTGGGDQTPLRTSGSGS